MAKTVTLTIRINTTGDGFNHSDVFTVTNNAAQTAAYFPALTGTPFFGPPGGGPNGTVLVPPKSTAGIPTLSGVSKTLIGSPSDQGFPLDPSAPVVLSGSSLGIAYGATEAATAIYF